jgi:hypothetical protein
MNEDIEYSFYDKKPEFLSPKKDNLDIETLETIDPPPNVLNQIAKRLSPKTMSDRSIFDIISKRKKRKSKKRSSPKIRKSKKSRKKK